MKIILVRVLDFLPFIRNLTLLDQKKFVKVNYMTEKINIKFHITK